MAQVKQIDANMLFKKYEEAMSGMYEEKGEWSMPFDACSMVVGEIEDAHGRIVQVTINIQADEDEWQ